MTVSKGMVFSYNAENRLVEASPQNPQQGSVKATYIYDYMGRRARKTLFTYSSGSWQKQKDISFIYDGWNMVKESEKTSDSSPEVPAYYVWGLDLSQSMQGAGGVGGLIASVKAGNEYLYSYDGNGNVGQMVKASDGSIAARYEYDSFGKTLFAEGVMASENPYRFSTKYQDVETGFYYYGYRYYDAEMGRWINRDPVGRFGGINIYGYLSNRPLNRFDYLGLLDETVEKFMKNHDPYMETKDDGMFIYKEPIPPVYDEMFIYPTVKPEVDQDELFIYDKHKCPKGYHYDSASNICRYGKPVVPEIKNEEGKTYCNYYSRCIAVGADAVTVGGIVSTAFSGGVSVPFVGPVMVTATVVSIANGLGTFCLCGPAPSHVTTVLSLKGPVLWKLSTTLLDSALSAAGY